MDSALKELLDLASKRGSRYVKGETSMKQLSEKVAELGVLLLEKSRKIQGLSEEQSRPELIEIQQKVDDLRKALFANKIIAR